MFASLLSPWGCNAKNARLDVVGRTHMRPLHVYLLQFPSERNQTKLRLEGPSPPTLPPHPLSPIPTHSPLGLLQTLPLPLTNSPLMTDAFGAMSKGFSDGADGRVHSVLDNAAHYTGTL